MEPRNRFQGVNSASLRSLLGRYDNPIPTRFLAPIDCLKIPALELNKSPAAKSVQSYLVYGKPSETVKNYITKSPLLSPDMQF
jgi:hypothetical protein